MSGMRRAKRNNPEEQIHIAVVEHLLLRATPGVVWWHTPNESKMHVSRRVKLKRMGVRAGVSDLILYRNREAFALELKAPGGRPTDAQLEFQSEWRANGGHAVVAEGLDQAIAVLEAWQLLRKAA